MKYKTLLPCVMMFLTLSVAAQKNKQLSGYAITGPNKGERGWKQVRLVDMKTGAELKSVYSESPETEILNARTGKPVEKKDQNQQGDVSWSRINDRNNVYTITSDLNAGAKTNVTAHANVDEAKIIEQKKLIEEKLKANNANSNVKVDVQSNNNVLVYTYTVQDPNSTEKKVIVRSNGMMLRGGGYDKPFATTSAACAYDKKHDRLYYTPMGIAQLRYIDLKAKKSTVYYFENEPFGVVAGMYDAGNQITRMVIAADGNGYALSNNAEHLVKFTTGKKPEIVDLGALTDDASNGRYTVHSAGAYGGDMVAGKSGSLYLLTASRHVFKIDIEQKTALHLGSIKGLPAGYQTNGAMVEEGSNIIVCSADSPEGYYIFDLNTLQAERYTSGETVFNASDLAGSNLVADKKQQEVKEVKQEEPVVVPQDVTKAAPVPEVIAPKSINVYPNPVTGSEVKVSFNDLPAGKYMIQLTDLNGKVISNTEANIYGKNQVETLRLPSLISKGSYLVKVLDGGSKNVYTEKIVVQ